MPRERRFSDGLKRGILHGEQRVSRRANALVDDCRPTCPNCEVKPVAESLAASYNADYRRCPGRRVNGFTIQLGRRRFYGKPGLFPAFAFSSLGSLPTSSVFPIVRPQTVEEAPDRGHRRYGVKDFKNDVHRHHSLHGSATRTRTPPAPCIVRCPNGDAKIVNLLFRCYFLYRKRVRFRQGSRKINAATAQGSCGTVTANVQDSDGGSARFGRSACKVWAVDLRQMCKIRHSGREKARAPRKNAAPDSFPPNRPSP